MSKLKSKKRPHSDFVPSKAFNLKMQARNTIPAYRPRLPVLGIHQPQLDWSLQLNSINYSTFSPNSQTATPAELDSNSRFIITICRSFNERAALAAKFFLADADNDNLTYQTSDSYIVVMMVGDAPPAQLWLNEQPFITIEKCPEFDEDALPDGSAPIDRDVAWDSTDLPALDQAMFAKLCRALVPFGLVDDKSPADIARHTAENEPKRLMLESQAKYGHTVCPMHSGDGKGKAFHTSLKTDRSWDATSNADELKEVLGHRSVLNKSVTGFSIVVGESDYCVIDIDTKSGGHAADGMDVWMDKFAGSQEVFKAMPIVQSPSGGLHLFYRYVKGIKQSTNAIGAGIDVKAGNSVVLAAGSWRSDYNSRYRHLPCHSFDLPPAEWDGHEHILFDVMFHGQRDRLAAVGLLSENDLKDIAHDDWFDYAQGKINDAGAERRAQLDISRAKQKDNMTIDQASSINNLGQVTLNNICNQLRNIPD